MSADPDADNDDGGGVPNGLADGKTVEVRQSTPEAATQTFDVRAGFGELTLEVCGEDRKEHLSPRRAERLAAVWWANADKPGGPKRVDAEAFADLLGTWAAWANDDVEWSHGATDGGDDP